MKALLSLIFLAVIGYLGYYVYNHLTQEERNKIVAKTKETLDKAGDVVTESVKKGLEKVDPPKSEPAEATP